MRITLQELFALDGKVALVTGGNRGIGRAIAWGLAGAGAAVAIAGRDQARTAQTVAELQSRFDVPVIGIQADVRHEDEVRRMVTEAHDSLGAVDILVSNAGMAIHKPAEEMTPEEWDLNLDTNLRSFFLCAQAVFPLMKTAGGGKIISVGSMFAYFGTERLPAYAASKGGIVQLTKSLAVGWAKYNIQVNCLMPGFIKTALSAHGRKHVPGMEESVAARTPAGRWGEPEDIAGAAVFLAGPGADFITGATLPIDGGYSVRG